MIISLLSALLASVAMTALAVPLVSATRSLSPPAIAHHSRARHRTLHGRRLSRVLDNAYPDALDLFVVSVQAGHLPFEALLRIAPHVHPVIADAIGETACRVQQGHRLIDALDALVDALGTRALSFVRDVALAERTGLAIGPMIGRIGDDARLHRRRLAESAARELPVRLSIPLVLCTLPSFVLVAIAPLLIGALSSLRAT